MRITGVDRIVSAAVALCALSAYSAFAAEVPTVEAAWVAAAPPVARVHAGYFTLHNLSAAAVDLVGVASPQYERAELHRTRVEGGVAGMARLEQVAIPAGGVLRLAPGGGHLMLIHPVAPMAPGDAVDIRLRFADGSVLAFTAPVRKPGGDASLTRHGGHGTH